MRQITVFVNLFQNLGSAWLHEASSRVSDRIYNCNRKKKREDKNDTLVSQSGFKPGVTGVLPFFN
jgi:hypothetical protein